MLLIQDEQKCRFQALARWFETPHGKAVAHAFDDELTHLSTTLHGNILLQMGSIGDNTWLKTLRFQHQWLLTPSTYRDKTTLVGHFTQLPFERSSIDCILAPLIMDGFSHKKNPLDEMDRVLKPMGYLVLFGINPFSFWGMWERFARNSCFGSLKGRPKSVFSLERTLLHHGYGLCYLNVFHYIPPFKNPHLINQLEILNELGKMISPLPSGFYCLVMQKQVKNLIMTAPALAPNPVNNDTILASDMYSK